MSKDYSNVWEKDHGFWLKIASGSPAHCREVARRQKRQHPEREYKVLPNGKAP
jgi:hypothetical protein